MNYAILINSSPQSSNAGLTAYRFIETALSLGHRVRQVFFYREGVHHAFRYATPASDERLMPSQWSHLAQQHGIDLVVCISAAQRRGLLHSDEARRQAKQDEDLAAGFRIAGLGQWVEASLIADRCIEFS